MASDVNDSCVRVLFLERHLPVGVSLPMLSDDRWLAAEQVIDVEPAPLSGGDGELDPPWLHGRQGRFVEMDDCDKISIGYFLEAETVFVAE